jgi:hypothetical protein
MFRMETTDNALRGTRNFTPAFPLLQAYDLVAVTFTRESTDANCVLRAN